MKREIGKWFLDIAKYIVTAVILNELFGGFEEKYLVVTVAALTAVFAFIVGSVILRDVDNRDKERKSEAQENKNSRTNNDLTLAVATKLKQSKKKKGDR